jgi:hypothetical protein
MRARKDGPWTERRTEEPVRGCPLELDVNRISSVRVHERMRSRRDEKAVRGCALKRDTSSSVRARSERHNDWSKDIRSAILSFDFEFDRLDGGGRVRIGYQPVSTSIFQIRCCLCALSHERSSTRLTNGDVQRRNGCSEERIGWRFYPWRIETEG